jgi:hypothetical protein
VKLAEALTLRTDATRRGQQLRTRIVANARFQKRQSVSLSPVAQPPLGSACLPPFARHFGCGARCPGYEGKLRTERTSSELPPL